MSIQQIPLDRTLKVVSFICPGFFSLDVLGAHTVFGLSPNAKVDMVWKTLEPVQGVPGISVTPTTTFDACEEADVFIVGYIPGDVIDDAEVISFIKKIVPKAKVVLAICGGTHLIAAAGLLEGIRATSNYGMVASLAEFGAIPVTGTNKVVVDGKFYSAGPVSGSIEAGITALAALRGQDIAMANELILEYDPKAVYGVGSKELAPPELFAQVSAQLGPYSEGPTKAALKVYRQHKRI